MISTATTGTNAVGMPRGNDGHAFFDRPSSGKNFSPWSGDYSMGIAGTVQVVPEPSFAALLIGLVGTAGLARRRRRL